MIKQPGNVEKLIREIKALTVAEKAKTGAVALLSAIPYAGGAVASVIGEIATHRKFEKVCDVLSDLNSKLEDHQADPERHLSKDQIIEVVHETLQTVSTASDDYKIAALKNGLAYSFLSEDAFERKQLFLQVLRTSTSLELGILGVVYGPLDPYIVEQGPPPPPVDPGGLRGTAVLTSTAYAGHWKPVVNTGECGQPMLLTLLAGRIRSDESTTQAVARLLDGKGLSSLGDNLQRRDCKTVSWSPALAGNQGIEHLMVRPTPLEASRTKFGDDFMQFGQGY